MANLTIGSKAILRNVGISANGFEVGETVLVAHNTIDGSREKGRIAFSKLNGRGVGYGDASDLIPVQEAVETKEVVNVVKVEIEGTKFEGTVADVLAVIKGLQELTEVKPATTAQFEKVKIETAEPVAVQPLLTDVIGVGTKIKITGNGHKGDLHPHNFKHGEVVTVQAHDFKGDAEHLGYVAVRATNGTSTYTVHGDHFVKYTELKPEVGMLAVVKDGKGEQGCLYGFEDGQLVQIVRIDNTDYKQIKVKKANGEEPIGYADLTDIDLLF